MLPELAVAGIVLVVHQLFVCPDTRQPGIEPVCLGTDS